MKYTTFSETYIKRDSIKYSWAKRVVHDTRVRGHFLWFDVDFDVAEFVAVAALWSNLCHRLGFLHQPTEKSIYAGLDQVINSEILTGVLLMLAVMGLMAVFLILPKIRRLTLLSIGTYFAVSGVIFFLTVPGSLSGWYHVLVFAPASAWAYWRLGEVEEEIDDRP